MPIIEELRTAVANQIIKYLKQKGGAAHLSQKRTQSLNKIQEILIQNNDSVVLRRTLENFTGHMNGEFLAIPSFSIFDGSKLRNLIEDVLKTPKFSEDNLAIQERMEIRKIQNTQTLFTDKNWQQQLDELNHLLEMQERSVQMLTEKNAAYEKTSNEMCQLYLTMSQAKIDAEEKIALLQNKLSDLTNENQWAKRFTELETKISEQDSRIQLLMAQEKVLIQKNHEWSEKYSSLESDYLQILRDNSNCQAEIAELRRQLKPQENAANDSCETTEARTKSLRIQ